MTALIDAALSRSRTVLLALVLLLIAGTVAFVSIPKESNPDINIPIIYVALTHEGISPEDATRLLVRPVEQELRGIDGVKEMRAMAFQGGANVILEFEAGFNADTALADVRQKVDDAKPELPAETDEPKVIEVNFSLFPVIQISLSGPVPERTLVQAARDLRDALESIGSVLEVDLAGDRDELVEIVIDPMRVESYGLSGGDVARIFDRNNRLVAAGALDTGAGRFAIKVPGLFEDVRDVLAMPVKVSDDATVTLGQIADIRRTFKDRETHARVNGHPAITLGVVKRSGTNVIATIEAVQAVVAAERANWPPGLADAIQVSFSQDQSKEIRTMLADLQNNVISAILLVMIVVVAALGVRSGLLVGVAIPGSFLTGLLVLYAGGLTVNIVVLFSLILAVGMLVDGAIVVTEFADRRLAEGVSRRAAYGSAAKRMAWPITASTATTLAAFLPLLFWPGVVGEFMKFLPITLIATLSASLFMALIFVPTLGSLFGAPSAGARRAALMKALSDQDLHDPDQLRGFTGAYVHFLRLALRHAVKVVIVAVVLLVGAWLAYARFGQGVEFFPEVEPHNAEFQIHARGNLSVAEQDALVRKVEAEVLAEGGARGEFKSVFTRVGEMGQGNDRADDVIGIVQVEFEDWEKRRPADDILTAILDRTRDIPGIMVEYRKEEGGPPVGKPIQVQLTGRDRALLDAAADRVIAAMEEVGGIIAIEDSRPLPGIEWQMNVDRAQAAKFGADIATIGSSVRLLTNGLKFSDYRPDDSTDEIDIVARYPEAYRTLDEFVALRVQTERGMVPIASFIDWQAAPKVGIVRRVGAQPVVTVKADVPPDVLVDNKVQALRQALTDAGIDPRVTVTFKGEDEEQQKAQAFLGQAFVVALFLMAMILVTQFNSFYSAFLILTAVVMSTVGVMIGLLIMNQPFGIVMNGIGVIALAGIVVNNNIVLIDTHDQLARQHPDPVEAILRTGAQRLRPVLLTTVTTILGLMPMVLQVNIDFVSREVSVGAPSTQWWVQLASSIVFGLAFATLLTLVVTPSLLMLRARARAWRLRRRHGATPVAAE